jgi:mannose-6-phosphate isomerase-like protein (cupin superfamily)
MQPEVRKYRNELEFETGERCFVTEVANDPGDELVSIARARVRPGMTTAWHRLDGIVERYVIASGEGKVEIGDCEPVDVSEGDVVRIPSRIRQRITNTGSGDLIFYCVCTPRFQASSYESLE